jgi:hypothetical protein
VQAAKVARSPRSSGQQGGFYEVRQSSMNLREPENPAQTVKTCGIQSVHRAKYQ